MNDGGVIWIFCDFGVVVNVVICNLVNLLLIYFVYYIVKIVLVVDKCNSGIYYLFILVVGDDFMLFVIGCWKFINGGVNWMKISGSYIIGLGYDYFNVKMKQVFIYEGYFWYICGLVGGGIFLYWLFYLFDGM